MLLSRQASRNFPAPSALFPILRKPAIGAAPAGLALPVRLFPTPLDDIPAAADEKTGHMQPFQMKDTRCRLRPT